MRLYLILTCFPAAALRGQGQPPAPTPPPAVATTNWAWQTSSPENDAELNVAALNAHRTLCERTGADACLVIHHDRIVQEWYSKRYKVPMYAMSSTKSVAGLLTGMLIDDGRIQNADVSVCSLIATWCSGSRAKVTVRHLLTMTSGLPMMRDSSVGFVSDKNAYVLRLVPTSEPGTTWAYSNEGAQLLSPLLDRAAREPIQDYARRRLFGPLGMDSTRLHVYPDYAWTYADMETTARDFARVGLLMLHEGKWNGRQIVSSAWVRRSTQSSQSLNPRYGLLWWIDPEIHGYAAHGHLDTDIHVIPDLDLVIVRMQSRPMPGVDEGEYEVEGLKLFRGLVIRPSGTLPVTEPDDRDVYSAALDSLFLQDMRQSSSLVVGDSTSASVFKSNLVASRRASPVGFVADLFRYFEDADSSSVRSFENRNRSQSAIPQLSPSRASVARISTSTMNSLPVEFDARWRAFYELYPKSAGLIHLSTIGYNSTGDVAIMMVDQLCGRLCGQGYLVGLRKNAGKWQVTYVKRTWTS